MSMPTDDISYAVLLDELMKRKVAAAEHHWDQPEWFVEQDELRIAVFVLLEIALQKLHLLIAQVLGLAVIEHREVSVLEIKAIERGMPGLFLVNLARNGRPHIVISRGKELREFIAIPNGPQRAPLGFGSSVVAALNRVAHADHETGVQLTDIAPHSFINLWLGIAGT